MTSDEECLQGLLLGKQYQVEIENSFYAYHLVLSSTRIGLDKAAKSYLHDKSMSGLELMAYVQWTLAEMVDQERVPIDVDRLDRFMNCLCCIIIMVASLYAEEGMYDWEHVLSGLQEKTHWIKMIKKFLALVTEKLPPDVRLVQEWSRETCYQYLTAAVIDLFNICNIDIIGYIRSIQYIDKIPNTRPGTFMNRTMLSGTRISMQSKVRKLLTKRFKHSLARNIMNGPNIEDMVSTVLSDNVLNGLINMAKATTIPCITHHSISLLPVVKPVLDSLLYELLLAYGDKLKCLFQECEPKARTSRQVTVHEASGVIEGRASDNPFGNSSLAASSGAVATNKDIRTAAFLSNLHTKASPSDTSSIEGEGVVIDMPQSVIARRSSPRLSPPFKGVIPQAEGVQQIQRKNQRKRGSRSSRV